MTDFKINPPKTAPAFTFNLRFAVGADTGSLYVGAAGSFIGTVLVGKGKLAGKEGFSYRLAYSEFLPPGTTIEITT
ncbi:MAG: hypothetical protein WC829_04330 [Hyphomicrobium sp.]|jgi:hypothetical protein